MGAAEEKAQLLRLLSLVFVCALRDVIVSDETALCLQASCARHGGHAWMNHVHTGLHVPREVPTTRVHAQKVSVLSPWLAHPQTPLPQIPLAHKQLLPTNPPRSQTPSPTNPPCPTPLAHKSICPQTPPHKPLHPQTPLTHKPLHPQIFKKMLLLSCEPPY